MKAIIPSLLIFFFFASVIFDCNNSNNPVSILEESTNLISNSSFETGGNPSLDGWFPISPDTTYVNFSNSAPQNGGKYSVSLRNVWTIPGRIWTYVIPATGTHEYRLSAWGKAITKGPFAGGYMEILADSSVTINGGNSYHFSDTLWTYAELIDTITASKTDTVIILLRGNFDQFSNGFILFDLCKFERVD